jgi:site-specific DNA-methyltransferase (adenine-specific)
MAPLPLILAYSRPDDIVLDPFAGSGSTAVAAAALNRRYIGIELDPQYATVARERLTRDSRSYP